MKHVTTLSTIALMLAAGSFALVGGCSKSEQSASTEASSELAAQQPATDPAATDQTASTGTDQTGNAPGTVAGESE